MLGPLLRLRFTLQQARNDSKHGADCRSVLADGQAPMDSARLARARWDTADHSCPDRSIRLLGRGEDVPGVMALHRKLLPDAVHGPEELAVLRMRPGWQLLSSETNGGNEKALLGYALFWTGRFNCRVECLGTAPQARRQGVAEELLDHTVKHARAAGCTAMFVSLRSENGPARRLFQKAGFFVTSPNSPLDLRAYTSMARPL